MKKELLIKLSRMLKLYSDVNTDKGILTYEGPLEPGKEVFIYENDDIIPAPDGEYLTDNFKIEVFNGKISKIESLEIDDEMACGTKKKKKYGEIEEDDLVCGTKKKKKMEEEINPLQSVVDELNLKITELENLIKEKDLKIKELEDKLAECSIDTPAEEKFKKETKNDKNLTVELIEFCRK